MGAMKASCILLVLIIVTIVAFFGILAFPFLFWSPDQILATYGIDIRSGESEDWRDAQWGYGILAKLKKLLPKNWGKKYVECDGSLQSPVDFNTSAVLHNSLLSPMQYSHYDARPFNDVWNVTNNGHTVQFSADFRGQQQRPFVSRGGLVEGRYYFRQLHFHWGSNDSFGSEHTIDGKQFPLEVHLVHSRDAEDKTPYKIAVLGILFEHAAATDEDLLKLRPSMPHVLDTVGKVREPGVVKQIRLPGFTLKDLLPAGEDYFRYYGSLTTPPCSQFLQWTVLKTPLKISTDKVDVFRNLMSRVSSSGGSAALTKAASNTEDDDSHIRENYRPVQKVGGRVINYFSG